MIDALTNGLVITIEPIPARVPGTTCTPNIASAPDITRVAPNVGVDAAELLGTITDRESQADFLKDSFLLRLQSL